MSDLRQLYQEVILDHNKRPRHFGALADCTHKAEGYNPICGDHYHIYLKVENGAISDVSFDGSGCAISKASASLMSVALKGQPIAEAEAIFEQVHQMLTGGTPDMEKLGKMAVLEGVKEFPTRIKCATLAWHTMKSALAGSPAAASTEAE